MVPSFHGRFRIKLLSRIALLCGGLFIGLLGVELLLRLLLPANPFSPKFPLFPHTKVIQHFTWPGVSPVSVVTTNRWGFRGDEPPQDWTGSITIVTVGGSTTRCTTLDDQKTWAALLQKKLQIAHPNAWVGNAGIDGQTTRAHLMLVREILAKIKPNIAIFLVGVNDLGLSIREDRKDHGIAADSPRSRRWKLISRSRLGQILYDWKRVLIDKVPVVQAGPSQPLKPLKQALPLPSDLTTLLPLLGEYRQNLHELIRSTRALGIQPVFMTQPMLFDDTPEWRQMEGSFYWIKETKGKLSAAGYWKLLEMYNHVLLEVCREEKADCFDLASAIPHDKLYFTDAVHYTEAGAERVAQKTSEYLKDKILH